MSATALLHGGMDSHCHLLPGVDDGARNLDESLAMIRSMVHMGLTGAFCTPHIMARYPGNSPARLRQLFFQFRQHVEEQFPDFQLALSAEYMLDDHFPALLEQGDLLTWDFPAWEDQGGEGDDREGARGPFLLIELPQYLLPTGYADMILSIFRAGMVPVLAHPERYYRILEAEELLSLHRQGVLFQGNLGSLSGHYGEQARQLASSWRKLCFYVAWGSDSHSVRMASQVLGASISRNSFP